MNQALDQLLKNFNSLPRSGIQHKSVTSPLLYLLNNSKQEPVDMWTHLVRIIFRNRLAILIGIAIITLFMGWKATSVRMSYDMTRMLPASDPGYLNTWISKAIRRGR
jgi:uncharacterized membrane protein YdfJ with MMPL/SSD domain